MADKIDYNEINEMIKEYLSFHGMEGALETFKAEEKQKLTLLQ